MLAVSPGTRASRLLADRCGHRQALLLRARTARFRTSTWASPPGLAAIGLGGRADGLESNGPRGLASAAPAAGRTTMPPPASRPTGSPRRPGNGNYVRLAGASFPQTGNRSRAQVARSVAAVDAVPDHARWRTPSSGTRAEISPARPAGICVLYRRGPLSAMPPEPVISATRVRNSHITRASRLQPKSTECLQAAFADHTTAVVAGLSRWHPQGSFTASHRRRVFPEGPRGRLLSPCRTWAELDARAARMPALSSIIGAWPSHWS
jgi:hypothetical protein